MAKVSEVSKEARAKVLALTEQKKPRKEIAAAAGLSVYAVYVIQKEAK